MRLIDADAMVKELTRPTGLYADCERCSWSISNECMDCIVEDVIKHMPAIEPVKHGHYNYIKYLYLVDGYYVVNETMQCSECNNSSLNDGCNYCSKCGAKLDEEPLFFRKKTIFIEGEDAIVPISYTEYKRADEWEYEIDRR